MPVYGQIQLGRTNPRANPRRVTDSGTKLRVFVSETDARRFRRRLKKRLRPVIQKVIKKASEISYEVEFKKHIRDRKLIFKGRLLNSVDTRSSVGFSVLIGVFESAKSNRPLRYAAWLASGYPHKVSNQEKAKLKKWVEQKFPQLGNQEAEAAFRARDNLVKNLVEKFETKGVRQRLDLGLAAKAAEPEFSARFNKDFKKMVLNHIAIKPRTGIRVR